MNPVRMAERLWLSSGRHRALLPTIIDPAFKQPLVL